jgi:TonB family protein
VSGSAAAHGVLLAIALVIPFTQHRPMPMETATVVALSGPIGGSPAPARAAAAAAAPPAAAPAPPPREAHAVREIPVPKPKERPETPKKKELPKPEPPKPAPPDTTPSSENATGKTPAAHPGAATTGTPAAPGAGAATGVTASIGGGDAALGWYGAAVKAALEAAWQKPYLENQDQVYSVVVAFDIARDGAARNVRVVEPSGVPSLDRSAIRAVMEASPLPAVPPAWSGDLLPVTMRFNFNPEAN